MTTVYASLKSGATDIVKAVEQEREVQYGAQASLSPLAPAELASRITPLWQTCSANIDAQNASSSKHVDLLRTALELVGKDIVIAPILSGELDLLDSTTDAEQGRFNTALQDRLDIILTLFETVFASNSEVHILEPGALFIPLLEELVELIPSESWRVFWNYFETRGRRFTKDMPASKGKALPLLRIINSLLRFLPRTPEDLVFRGRVHQFASSVISVADKSAVNLRGDYNDIKTIWDEPQIPLADETSKGEDGDVEMSAETSEEKDVQDTEEAVEDSKAETELELYPTLWSLQQYFASPPALDGPATKDTADAIPRTPFETFRAKTDIILPMLFEQTQKEKELLGKDAEMVGKKRKRGGNASPEGERGKFFHPRYLTGKKLLDHELADSSFRRQILVQYFILFQFLLNLTPSTAAKQAFTGGMPKSFVIKEEDETWVKSKISAIKDELRRMVPDGPTFEETVISIITRERYYVSPGASQRITSDAQAQWKNDGCPENIFEIPPLEKSAALPAVEAWRKRMATPAAYPFKLGSRSLSRLWLRGYTSIDQLKGWKRNASLASLHEEIRTIEVDEEDDKAMGREPSAEDAAATKERKTNLTWRALRLASRTDLRHFAALTKARNVNVLVDAIQGTQDRSVPVHITADTADAATDDEGEDGPKTAVEPPVSLQQASDTNEGSEDKVAAVPEDLSIPVDEPTSGVAETPTPA